MLFRSVTAREAAIEGSLTRQVAVNGVLMPMAGLLGDLADLHGNDRQRRAKLHGQVERVVLPGLVDLVDATDARACFYELEGDKPTRQLVAAGSWGRTDMTTRPFTEGTPEGDEAIAALDARETRLWSSEDSGAEPPGWSTSKSYNAYIAVPVATANRVHGMLTVDAPAANAFDFEVDAPTVELLGRFLAAALSA